MTTPSLHFFRVKLAVKRHQAKKTEVRKAHRALCLARRAAAGVKGSRRARILETVYYGTLSVI